MNKLFSVLFSLIAAPLCFAQGGNGPDSGPTDAPSGASLAFAACLSGANALPPNTSLCSGSGTFTLFGSTLNYDVRLPFPNLAPTAGGIYGPATSGTNGDVIFAWTNYIIVPGSPSSGFRGAWQYQGTCTLTSDQMDQLKAGLWYVNITSADFPDGELRGQISVPSAVVPSDGPAPLPVVLPALTTAPDSSSAQDVSRVLPGPVSGPK